MKKIAFAALTVSFPLAAFAHDGLKIEDAYARGANPKAGAAFMTIENHRDTDCQLIAATSDIAARVELHTHKEVDGVMKMMQVEEGFSIPAKGSHALARGGDHVMFMGLHAPLKTGDEVSVMLDFGECGSLDVTIPVDNERKPEHGMAHGKMKHDMHKGHDMGGMSGETKMSN